MPLTNYEQETIINFNKEEKIAYIFTYEKTWQKHLEKKLGLKPIMVNGFGGKEYKIDKKRIPMPRVPRKVSAEQRKILSTRLSEARLRKVNNSTVSKSKTKTSNG